MRCLLKNRGKGYVISAAVSILAVLLVAIGPFMALPAVAQSEPTGFTNVTLSIYPEYDNSAGVKPSLLVMLDGQIKGAVAPTTVRFLVPQKAVMYSAGSGPRDKYQGGPPNRKASDIAGWDEISYTVTTNTFRVEYYDPNIVGLPDKTISYDFRTLYPISDIVVVIQEPKRSSNFKVQPKEQSIVTDGEQFQVRQYMFSSLAAGTVTHFDISYTKADSTPSLPQNTGAAPGSGSSFPVGWVVVGLAVLLAGLVYAAVKGTSRRKPVPARMQQRPAPAGQKARPLTGIPQGGREKRFCTECGNRIEAQTKFCPHCGARR